MLLLGVLVDKMGETLNTELVGRGSRFHAQLAPVPRAC